VITKTKFWEKIIKELKEVERSKNFTQEVMKRIKEIPQDEVKDN
jgi:hypothetical protein